MTEPGFKSRPFWLLEPVFCLRRTWRLRETLPPQVCFDDRGRVCVNLHWFGTYQCNKGKVEVSGYPLLHAVLEEKGRKRKAWKRKAADGPGCHRLAQTPTPPGRGSRTSRCPAASWPPRHTLGVGRMKWQPHFSQGWSGLPEKTEHIHLGLHQHPWDGGQAPGWSHNISQKLGRIGVGSKRSARQTKRVEKGSHEQTGRKWGLLEEA